MINKNNINCYVHIPFCRSKCKYCRFASFSWLNYLQIKNYVSFLTEEINKFDWNQNILDTIYFGWGTPWILEQEDIKNIILALKQKFEFNKKIEINLEINPNNISLENLTNWKNIWINRISIWVQTLNQESLKEIWRSKKWDIINSLDIIEKSWLINDFVFSIDFIIWLPYVKKWEILLNIKTLLEKYAFIKHISIYMLEEYYDIPDEVDSKFEKIIYPNKWHNLGLKEDEYLDEYSNINTFLRWKWFERYEISNYSLPWYQCSHNKWYWEHKNYIWFWAWAHSFIDNTRISNLENLEGYYKWLKNKEKLSSESLKIEKLMFDLRTNKLNIYDINDKELLNSLINDWLLEINWDSILLTDKWVLLIDFILDKIIQ